MKARDPRILDALKASRIKIVKGIPNKNEGNEGDLAISQFKGDVKLYVKHRGVWHGVLVGKSFDNLKNKIEKLSNQSSSFDKRNRMQVATNKIVSDSNFTLDSSGDIRLDADGGNVEIYDDTAKHFMFDCDNTRIRIFDDADEADYLSIAVDANGAATIATNDSDGENVGHITLDALGDIILDSRTGVTKFYINGDTDDLCTLTVAANGVTTLATADSDGTAANLKLDIDGDIELNADGGQVTIKDSLSSHFLFDCDSTEFTIYDDQDAGDLFMIRVGQHGATTMFTTDDDATAANFVLDIDGDITLDSHSGNFIASQAGAEFSVANSSYAGMILGYAMIGEDAVHTTYTTTTSFAVPDSAMTVRFEAPPSGAVEVEVQVYVDAASGRYIYFGLSDNATYNALGDSYEHLVHRPDETDETVVTWKVVVTGLTAGDTYNYWFGAKGSGGTNYLRWGGTASLRYTDFIMKVTALPAATANYAVYD